MKRLSALLLAALLLVSCGEQYDMRRDLSIYFSNTDEVVRRIRSGIKQHWGGIEFTYTSHGNNMGDLEDVAAQLMELAYSETDDPAEGDYLFHQTGGYEVSYGYTATEGEYSYTVKLAPAYYTTLRQEEKVDEAVAGLAEVFTGSEYDRIRAVYQYLKDSVSFDKTAAKSESNHLKTTAYAALVQHTAVCQGYSVAAYRLLRECGISARVVTGTVTLPDGTEEYHAWNLAAIGGRFYNLDITWDDQLGGEGYFLKSDDDIPDHRREEKYLSDEFLKSYPMSEKSWETESEEKV